MTAGNHDSFSPVPSPSPQDEDTDAGKSVNFPVVNVVQFSDPHLFTDKAHCLLGMNTEDSFQQVLALLTEEQPDRELLLITGDIAQAPSPQTYQRFYEAVSALETPHYWLQGNHDLDAMFNDSRHTPSCITPCVIERSNWTILMLNSSVDHEVAGRFSRSELEWLENQLQLSHGRHVMVTMHHHPLPVGSAWLDHHMLAETRKFWAVIDRFPNVRAIVHGHVHQAVDKLYGRVRILGCPSTCIQFKPGSREFALDKRPPGYRWLNLMPDGRIETAVSRLDKIPPGVDFESLGY